MLRPGDVVLLEGEMGSGKSTFVRGACRALGYAGPVTSPTFTLAHGYEGGPVAISHLDLHRIERLGADDEGLADDHLTEDRIAFVEWPAAIEGLLVRPPRLRVRFEHRGGDRRAVTVIIGG